MGGSYSAVFPVLLDTRTPGHSWCRPWDSWLGVFTAKSSMYFLLLHLGAILFSLCMILPLPAATLTAGPEPALWTWLSLSFWLWVDLGLHPGLQR